MTRWLPHFVLAVLACLCLFMLVMAGVRISRGEYGWAAFDLVFLAVVAFSILRQARPGPNDPPRRR